MLTLTLLITLACVLHFSEASSVTCLIPGYPFHVWTDDYNEPNKPILMTLNVPEEAQPYNKFSLRVYGKIVSVSGSVHVKVLKGAPSEHASITRNGEGFPLSPTSNPQATYPLPVGTEAGVYTLAFFPECDGWLDCAAFLPAGFPFVTFVMLEKNNAQHARVVTNRITGMQYGPVGSWVYWYGTLSATTDVYINVQKSTYDSIPLPIVSNAQVDVRFTTDGQLPTTSSPLITDVVTLQAGDFIIGTYAKEAQEGSEQVYYYVTFGYGTQPFEGEPWEAGECPDTENMIPNAKAPTPPAGHAPSIGVAIQRALCTNVTPVDTYADMRFIVMSPPTDAMGDVPTPMSTTSTATPTPTEAASSHTFGAHKLFVTRFPYFEMLLSSGMREAQLGEIEVSECDSRLFALVLSFMYTDRLRLTDPQDALELLAVANRYELNTMKAVLERLVEEFYDFSDVNSVLNLVELSEALQCKGLLEVCKFRLLSDYKKSYIQEALAKFECTQSVIDLVTSWLPK